MKFYAGAIDESMRVDLRLRILPEAVPLRLRMSALQSASDTREEPRRVHIDYAAANTYINASVASCLELVLASSFRRNEVRGPMLMDKDDAFFRARACVIVLRFAWLSHIRTWGQ